MLEKTLESLLDSKEIQPVRPKGDQSWVFIGRTDVEAETPIFWPPDVKNWLIWNDPDIGKDWRQEEKGMTEDEMVGWHHQLNEYVLVNSGSWWWTGRPGMLRFMGSQRAGHDWVTELTWNSILKNKDITLPTKVHPVKAMVFPVVMYRCKSWTVKKAEHQRIDAFELWC